MLTFSIKINYFSGFKDFLTYKKKKMGRPMNAHFKRIEILRENWRDLSSKNNKSVFLNSLLSYMFYKLPVRSGTSTL